ncbi:uncharacterized protein LOC126674448 [Mercurialis annua]|uniref:uncharacterized protein LOC126674448 n=1 Tax=Mercurialis annua TaxID=3986 RepID=UPI00215F0F7E|nr:uncharacterized protein LOC126674448 [Mercurialis annua]
MKRQRNVDAEQNAKAKKGGEGVTTARRRRNAAGKKDAAEAKEMEERKVEGDGDEDLSPRMVESCVNWGELSFWDEQMSWGSTWLPFWDVEYMGEACREMFSDVVWGYDIWNFDEIPNPK